MKTENVQVWSCGGGRQSGAIATLIAQGKLPKPDLCFMVDTGREKSGTWPFVDGFIRPQLAQVGLELEIVKAERFANIQIITANGDIQLPGFTTKNGEVGKLPAFCSGSWKRDVAERWLRSLGVVTATSWVGISVDEMRRVRRPHRAWLKLWYPLVFAVQFSSDQAVNLIRLCGWTGIIPRSACKMCPNMHDEEWLDMKLNWLEDFADAVAIEREIRETDPHFWMHPACVPLDTIDFSNPPTDQLSMFAERGCTTGCFT